jgi:hypothetical protein
MNHFAWLGLGAACALTAVACSANTEDLFGSVGGSGGKASSTTSGGMTTTSGGMTTTSGGMTTTSGGTTTTSGGMTTTSGGMTTTSGGMTTTSGGMTTTTGSGGGPQVTCNNMQCSPGDVCCFNPFGPGDHCAMGAPCGNLVQLKCNGPEDCPGQICCAKFQNQNLVGTACQSSCNGGNEVSVCNPAAADPCPNGGNCTSIAQITGDGYSLCLN